MDKLLYDVLCNISQGVVFLDQNFKILLWNEYMEYITGINKEKMIDKDIYEAFPNLKKHYFRQAITNVLNNGYKFFFSAAMHNDLINTKEKINLEISRFEKDDSKFLLFEFMNITSEFIRINELKQCVNELCVLNCKLKEEEKIIRNLAYHDKLTGLANRALFYELAENLLNTAKRNRDIMAVMFIDIDRFKNMNDIYGHEIGDKVLIRVAESLSQSTRKSDVVARYGGDEFLIVLPQIGKIDNYKIVASKIINKKNQIISIDENAIDISLSIGVSFYPNDGDTLDKLIAQADCAMYSAKRKKENDTCSYVTTNFENVQELEF